MIDFNRPPVVGTELAFFQEALESGKLCGDGAFTKKVSDWFSSRFHVKHVYMTTSCTSALEMASWLCDLKSGDEVIMPSYTFVSTADAFVLRGAKIVFVDVDPKTMNIVLLGALVKAMGIDCIGKDIFCRYGELLTHDIELACAKAGLLDWSKVAEQRDVTPKDLPGRSPCLCPGCPHRSTFFNLAKMKDLIIVSDIGCYNLGALAPFHATDFMGSMGAGFGVAHGFEIAEQLKTGQKIIGIVGDSTFYHNGVTPLLNMVHNGSNITLMVLDNSTTAMTGRQDHPGVPQTLMGKPVKPIDMEAFVRSMGVEDVVKVDAFDVKAVDKTIRDALNREGLSFVIVQGPCFQISRKAKPAPVVDINKCNGCGTCFKLGCSAIARTNIVDEKTGFKKSSVDPVLCVGCTMCEQVCPRHAIGPKAD